MNISRKALPVIPTRPQFVQIMGRGIPVFIGMSSTMLTSWVDTWVAGFFGVAAIAAIGICGFIFFFLFSFANGFAIAVQGAATQTLKSQASGGVLISGLLFGLLFSLTLTAVALLFVARVTALVAPDAAVADNAALYMTPLVVSLPFYYTNAICRGYLTAIGKAWAFTWINLAIQMINLVGSLVLALGIGPFPSLGLFGIGVATCAAYACGSMLYGLWLIRLVNQREVALGDFRLPGLAPLIPNAMTAGLNQNIYALGWILSFWIVGLGGTVDVAVYHILLSVTLCAIYVSNALGTVAVAEAGRLTAAQEWEHAVNAGRSVAGAAIGIILVFAVCVAVFSAPLLQVFVPSAEDTDIRVFAAGVLILPVYAWGTIINHALQGAGCYRQVMLASGLCQWGLFLPLSFGFSQGLGWGLAGVIAAEAVYRAILAGNQAISFSNLSRHSAYEQSLCKGGNNA